jgi:hypothetical protein
MTNALTLAARVKRNNPYYTQTCATLTRHYMQGNFDAGAATRLIMRNCRETAQGAYDARQVQQAAKILLQDWRGMLIPYVSIKAE